MSNPAGTNGAADPGLTAIMNERRRLIGLAYRMLGSLAEAEDAVQETYARWYAMPVDQQQQIETPAAWLTRVASRICLDLLGSARARRERYVGEWIPEPLPGSSEWTSSGLGMSTTGAAADPADRVTLDESISMAFLVVLESMTPAERVAFILHDVFRYPFADIAEIVGRSPAACRQLATSARRRVSTAAAAGPASAQTADVVRDFKLAWEAKDIGALIRLLDPDAVATSDGGGVVSALPYPVHGGESIASGFLQVTSLVPELTLEEQTVNGRPGLVLRQAGEVSTVLAFDVVDGLIKQVWAVRNPEKLRPWRG